MSFFDRLLGRQPETPPHQQRSSTPDTPAASMTPETPAAPTNSLDANTSWYVPKGDPHRFGTTTGIPALHLITYQASAGTAVLRLCEDNTGLLVSPTDMRLPKIGIFVSNLRGEVYHQAGCKAGDFQPGARVILRREPQNEHEKNAVAVYDQTGQHLAAYVNKQKARMLSRLLDAGEEIAAITLIGTPAGESTTGITILAASPDLIDHLRQPRPVHLPPPVHQI